MSKKSDADSLSRGPIRCFDESRKTINRSDLVITLRQLRYLDALSRLRHFGRAAEECAVTQPALSMQIQDLEAALGVPLVERKRGRIDVTREGEEVVRRARRVLNEVRDIVDYAQHCGRGLQGPVRLGVIPSIAPYLLPSILPAVGRRFPDLELHVRETQTANLLDELLRGTLDVLLLALPIDNGDIETLSVLEDRFLLAIPNRPGMQQGQRVGRDFVRDEELLLLEEGHCLRDQALEYCGMVRPEMLSSFGATSLATILQLVANGYGITLLPEISLGAELQDPRVTLLRFEPPEPSRTVGLAWRKSCPRGEAFKELAGLISTARGEADAAAL